MKNTLFILAFLMTFAVVSTVPQAIAANEIPSEVTLIKNVNVWDGRSDDLKKGYDVLIVRNLIKKVAKDIPTSGNYEVDTETNKAKTIEVNQPGAYTYTVKYIGGDDPGTKAYPVKVVDGKGATLMPGLVDHPCEP